MTQDNTHKYISIEYDYKSQKLWFHSSVLDGLAEEGGYTVAWSEPNKEISMILSLSLFIQTTNYSMLKVIINYYGDKHELNTWSIYQLYHLAIAIKCKLVLRFQ